MEKYLEQVITITKSRNAAAKEGKKDVVREQETKLAKIFKEAKANGVDINLLNHMLVNATS